MQLLNNTKITERSNYLSRTKRSLQRPQKFLTILTTALLMFAIGCADGGGGEWASGVPDEVSQGQDSSGSNDNPNAAPVIPGFNFSFNSGTKELAYGPGVTWNGCDPNAMVMGGYDSDTKCGNGTVYPGYAEHLDKNFFRCVEVASADANYRQPERVFIRHWGTYVDRNARNSSSLSMHAYARAIDIVKFILYDRMGGTTQVSTHVRDFKGSTAKFYNSFRQCWKDTLPSSCKPGQREYIGSIGISGSALGGNSLHDDHIHLSYPLCAG